MSSKNNATKIDKSKSARSIKLGNSNGRLKVEIGEGLGDKTREEFNLREKKARFYSQGQQLVDSAAKWAKDNAPALVALGIVGVIVTRKQGLNKTLSWVATTVSTAAISKLFH